MKSGIIAVLKSVPLFVALTEAEIASLAARTSAQSYSPGQWLFAEGDPCAGLYVVASGRVRIFKTSPSGREQVLAVQSPPSSIAELPVFDGGPYPASAAAIDASEFLFISRAHFRAFCLEHPEVSLKVLQVVGSRLRRLVGIIEELSFSTVRDRLVSWLLRQAKTEGRPAGEGLVFTLGIGHQELAARIGTVRELVSRNIARLEAQGFLRVEGHEVFIVNIEGLENEMRGGQPLE